MADPTTKKHQDNATAQEHHDAITRHSDEWPEDLRYPDKQPEAAAWIIHHHAKQSAITTRENLLFVWAGHVGARPEPLIRQLLQALDILDAKE